MNLKTLLSTLIQEGQTGVEGNLEAGKNWLILHNPISISEIDSNVFGAFNEVYKRHRYDIAMMLCSIQDIQTFALHHHFAEQSDEPLEIREAPILAAGQPVHMTSKAFRKLMKREGIELDWMGVFNMATEMQWWALLMLRTVVGAIHVTDSVSEEHLDSIDAIVQAQGIVEESDGGEEE